MYQVQVGNFLSRPCVENDTKWKEKDIYCSDFWVPIFKNTLIEGYLNEKYCVEDDEPYVEVDDVTELLYGKDQ